MSKPSSAANHLHEKPRRFYKAVAVAPLDDGYAVQLDGRTAKTPAGKRLVLPTEALAGLLAREWEAQTILIDTSAMHGTRLAFTVIDKAAGAREGMARQIAGYAGSDLICYFAEIPPPLTRRQEAQWGPWLTWAERALDLRFVRAAGVAHRTQPVETLGRVEELALGLDDFTLTATAFAAGLFGSAVLALALQRRALSGADAFALSRLDEAFQQEQWGIDEEAAIATARRAEEAAMLGQWFTALDA